MLIVIHSSEVIIHPFAYTSYKKQMLVNKLKSQKNLRMIDGTDKSPERMQLIITVNWFQVRTTKHLSRYLTHNIFKNNRTY